MIKINLLDSVTDRQRSVAAVEVQVANPRTRTWLLAVVVVALLGVGAGLDWYSASTTLKAAQEEVKREEEIAARMAAVTREQEELEKKIKAIETRIDAIKKLRASQKGPVSVLNALNERLPPVPDFRLENVEQKDGSLIIEGHSPNESAVTQFGRRLEFSSGLFTSVSIETERKDLEVQDVSKELPAGAVVENVAKPETVKFRITCKYAPPADTKNQAQPDAKKAAAPQVAKA